MSDMEDNINFGDDADMVEVENDEFEDQFFFFCCHCSFISSFCQCCFPFGGSVELFL